LFYLGIVAVNGGWSSTGQERDDGDIVIWLPSYSDGGRFDHDIGSDDGDGKMNKKRSFR